MTTHARRRTVFRPVDREAVRKHPSRRVNDADIGGQTDAHQSLLTRQLRAALATRPLHVSFVPARAGENSIAEKDRLELPVLQVVLAAHSKTSDDSPDFHAINQHRPPMIGITMAEQALRGDTLPTMLADIFEGGVLTTYGGGHRFPLQDMTGYEMMCIARGPAGKRSMAVSYLRDVAAAYNATATDVLYHEETDAKPSEAVKAVLVFEAPETFIAEVAPDLLTSPELRHWYSPYAK